MPLDFIGKGAILNKDIIIIIICQGKQKNFVAHKTLLIQSIPKFCLDERQRKQSLCQSSIP